MVDFFIYKKFFKKFKFSFLFLLTFSAVFSFPDIGNANAEVDIQNFSKEAVQEIAKNDSGNSLEKKWIEEAGGIISPTQSGGIGGTLKRLGEWHLTGLKVSIKWGLKFLLAGVLGV
ncbi:hypothetical protein [Pasteuria penetrans]|uniref:hypothetical protein n=1 Tax=Pasteuria penetrans TaxID=86005 RepID=UPI000FC23208|nr:hypothetical protein [Pasteuria penetrans]